MTIENKDEIIAELEAELKKYKDMAAKGLEEFKDVGGCWGCGLQLQLNQDLEDIKHLKAENDRLKKEIKNNKSAYQVELSTYNMECGNLLEENKNLIEENERLKVEIKQLEDFIKSDGEIDHINHEYTYKLRTCLQEIKTIAEQILNNNEFVYQNHRDIRQIVRLITKAEEE